VNPNSPFRHLQFPAELACEFFAVFSRFEFALKECGFRRPGRNGVAEPYWDKFAGEIAESFNNIQDQEFAEATKYLLDDPPMRQVIESNNITWRPPVFDNKAPPAKSVLLAVRTVRNNLFHGGKHTPHSPRGRDQKLVQACLTVLQVCLTVHGQLRDEYETSAF
jgi:hypothetical protein